MEREAIDGLFFSYYEDIDRWYNDHAPSRSGPTGSPATLRSSASAETTILNRTARQSAFIDGGLHDLPRFLSRARYGSTTEYRRYDAFSLTHLSGTYYESLCKRHGYDVRHVNHATRVDIERLGERYAPRYVFVSSTFMTETANIVDMLQHVRRAWPEVPVVMGGLFLVELQKAVAPALFQRFLTAFGADVYVVSPLGEAALLALLGRGERAIPDLSLPGAWVRVGRSYVHDDADEPGLPIDEHYVRWDEIDSSNLYHAVHTRTARSCAFVCSFCSYFSNQGPLVLEQPETLARELEHLARVPGVRTLIFTDDTFNVPQARFRELLAVLRRFDYEWYSFFRAQFADEELVAEMADSGCRGVMMGIESLDDRVLRNMQKAATRKAYSRGVEALKRRDIATHANFIIGFPGDVPENTAELVRWVDGHGVDFFCATPWFCSPATPIYQRREEFGVVGEYYRWKHDTMDVERAIALEETCMEAATSSVFMTELGARNFWTELLLYSNGLSVPEAQQLVRTYNSLCGGDRPLAELEADGDYREAQRILARHGFPSPPGAEHYLPPEAVGARR